MIQGLVLRVVAILIFVLRDYRFPITKAIIRWIKKKMKERRGDQYQEAPALDETSTLSTSMPPESSSSRAQALNESQMSLTSTQNPRSSEYGAKIHFIMPQQVELLPI